MAIGERIKRIRNFRKLTQAQLGKAVGLSDVRIRQYEICKKIYGTHAPNFFVISRASFALFISIPPPR